MTGLMYSDDSPKERSLPATVSNRVGLSAVRYRIGNFTSFREALLLAAAKSEALKGWTYHQSDDYGVMLFEMWAYIADILTFYQERIANEAWLSTCTGKDSAARLAELVDYRPKPGVSASVFQAFFLEKEKTLKIPAGTRIKSRPTPGNKPQVFETTSDLLADWRLNSLPVRGCINNDKDGKNTVQEKRSEILAKDALEKTFNLLRGDRLLFFQGETSDKQSSAMLQEVTVKNLRYVDGRPLLEWDQPLIGFSNSPRCYKMLGRMHVFGYDAPSSCVIPDATNEDMPYLIGTYDHTGSLLKGGNDAEWSVDLDDIYDGISLGDNILILYDDKTTRFIRKFSVTSKTVAVATAEAKVLSTALNKNAIKLTVAEKTVTHLILKKEDNPPTIPDKFDARKVGWANRRVARRNRRPKFPVKFDARKVVVYWLSRDDVSFWGKDYSSTISGNSFLIPLGSLDFPLSANDSTLRTGRVILLQGKDSICIRGTIKDVKIDDVKDDDGSNDLKITVEWNEGSPTDIILPAVLYGNVVSANHGETIRSEVLGDGDASAKFQTFSLKKSPLTYVSSPGSDSGVKSTLEVRVSDEQWQQVSSFIGKGGKETVFAATLNDLGQVSIKFGDGVFGSRLFSGKKNIVAKYRVGLGTAGNIDALTLTTLLDKPAGVKKTFNPIKSYGGADPESLNLIRKNAANRARSFNRIVSLTDYEDAAREYPGVAKARARWVWQDGSYAVHLAVAGQDAAKIEDLTFCSLLSHIKELRDPRCKLIVERCEPVYINLEIMVEVKSGKIREDVQSRVRSGLLNLYSFDNAEPGRWVRQSDIYAFVQAVFGVESLKLNRMGRDSLNLTPQDLQMGYIELALLKDDGLILI